MKMLVKRRPDKFLLVIEWEQASTNFWVWKDGKVSWVPKWDKLQDAWMLAQIIEEGNRKLRKLGYFERRIGDDLRNDEMD